MRQQGVSSKNMMVFSLWSPHSELEVDLFVQEPFDFQDVASRSLRVELGHSTATVIGLADLLRLKRAAGRTQDLADIEALEALEAEAWARSRRRSNASFDGVWR